MAATDTDFDILDVLLESHQISERQYCVWAERQKGWTMQEIADYLGHSSSTVYSDLRRVDVALSVAREEKRDGVASTGITFEEHGEVVTKQDTPLKHAIMRLRDRVTADYKKKTPESLTSNKSRGNMIVR